jgi:hypothetical protein
MSARACGRAWGAWVCARCWRKIELSLLHRAAQGSLYLASTSFHSHLRICRVSSLKPMKVFAKAEEDQLLMRRSASPCLARTKCKMSDTTAATRRI